jgi:hypothetical protein
MSEIELGDYVQSTENPGITYIVIGLHTCNNQARVRIVPRSGNIYKADGWYTLPENVYTCNLDILEKVE